MDKERLRSSVGGLDGSVETKGTPPTIFSSVGRQPMGILQKAREGVRDNRAYIQLEGPRRGV